MGALVAPLVLVLAVGAFGWLILGPIGQRGRATRAERNGKPNGPMIASMVAIVIIVTVLIAVRH
jgi:hypothetical protein